MKATRYMRKPFFTEGHQVDKDNMGFIADWCQGKVVLSENGDDDFIRVPVIGAKNARQTEARIGSHVLKSMHGGRNTFKIYSDTTLAMSFVMVPSDDDEPTPVVPEQVDRSNVRPLRVPPPTPAIFSDTNNHNARVI